MHFTSLHSPLQVQFSKQYDVLFKTNEDDQGEINYVRDFVVVVFVCVTILVALVTIITLLSKLLGNCGGQALREHPTAGETNQLLAKEEVMFTYGACEEEDEESGKCSSSSSDDFYNGKICVICYDKLRNCFFVPCGHCAACHVCAQRIFEGENKTCPVCRRIIHKVRTMLIP